MVLLVFAAYLPALNAEFAITDDRAVARNPRLTDPDGLRRIWFSTESEQYQPLTYTSFWIERRLWGLRAEGYHLVNIVLHAANALLVWLLLSKIVVRGAALAALLFAVYPVSVESVAWIYERKNGRSGLFFFADVSGPISFRREAQLAVVRSGSGALRGGAAGQGLYGGSAGGVAAVLVVATRPVESAERGGRHSFAHSGGNYVGSNDLV